MPKKNITNILVVEDDKSTVEIISRALSSKDCRVTMSLNMEDALLGFENMSYDLVIADLFMTGMGGIEGIRRMREIRPEIKILATSAGYSEMTPDEALKAAGKIGADDVLPKPFGLDELRQIVAKFLEED
ncbi:MAG: response regulator [Proteobacteria bacterium]|nr:response regulator [Pseudomonadota bacterium]